jgi:hypothetical protein
MVTTTADVSTQAALLGTGLEGEILMAGGRHIEAVVEVQTAVNEADWSKLFASSLACLGLGDASLGYLIAGSDARSRSREHRIRLLDEARDVLARTARSASRDAILQSVRSLLDPETEEQLEESLAKLEAGETEGVELLDPFDPPDGIPVGIHRQALALANMCRVRGLQGLIHAEFQRTWDQLADNILPVAAEDIRHALREMRERFEAELFAALRELQSLFSDSDLQEARARAERICADIRRSTIPFVRSQAMGHRAVEQLRSAGKGGASEDLGAELADAGFATRLAIASYAACGRLAGEALESHPTEAAGEVIQAAASKAFEFSLEDGRNTALHHLATTDDGRLVDIEGFVDDLAATRIGGQFLVGRITLHDPSSGASASVAAQFVNPRNVGIVKGAFCRVTGRFRESSTLLEDEPGVEAERLDLGAASDGSWLLAFLRLADPWFQIWRNSLGIRWGLGPHLPDADDPELFTGAAEIVFAPLIRKEAMQ